MRHQKYGLLLIVVLSALVTAAGCHRGAPKQLDVASRALDQAKEACADRIAVTEYRQAEYTLQQAEKMVEREYYGAAKRLAEKAEEEAVVATSAAEAAMPQVKAEAERTITEANSAVEKATKANASIYQIEAYHAMMNKQGEAQGKFRGGGCGIPESLELSREARELGLNAAHASLALAAMQEARADRARIEDAKAFVAAMIEKYESRVGMWTVQRGECLWCIAAHQRTYENPTKWPEIYNANKDQIKDPDLIYPGQELTIP